MFNKSIVQWRRMLGAFICAAAILFVSSFSHLLPVKDIFAKDSDRPTVVVTLFPYYDFVRAVAGPLVDLKLVLPPGQESHSFEPTASDLIIMQDADVLIYNGGESEQWVDKVLSMTTNSTQIQMSGMDIVSLFEEENGESSKETLQGHSHSHAHEEEEHDAEEHHEDEDEEEHESEHEEEEHEYDEHIWTSPVNAIALVEAVKDTLLEVLPDEEETLTANANAYIEQISALDEEFRALVDEADNPVMLVADRFPLLYFAREYGIEWDAAFSGCSTDTEPAAATLASLIDKVETLDIPCVYVIELSSRKTATIIAEATGAEIIEFHSCHNVTKAQLQEGVTYVSLMQSNLEALKKGLSC